MLEAVGFTFIAVYHNVAHDSLTVCGSWIESNVKFEVLTAVFDRI